MQAATQMAAREAQNVALEVDSFFGLAGQLKQYRIVPELLRRKGGIRGPHPFVRGLRLSSRIVHILRLHLEGTGATASWGQMLAEGAPVCSPECDVIVHRDCKRIEWNGDTKTGVMQFRFVPLEYVLAVVSCKSFLGSVGKRLRAEREALDGFVERVYLFAECCYGDRCQVLSRQAMDAGYAGLWQLYTLDRATSIVTEDPEHWLSFLHQMRALAGNSEA